MERISVRNLVEFILRSGDIEGAAGGGRDVNAMLQGSRLHRLIQKNRGPYYRPEVSLNVEVEGTCGGQSVDIRVEGRADGIIETDTSDAGVACMIPGTDNMRMGTNFAPVIINEIKTMYADVLHFTEPVAMHRNQAMCYAAMYFLREGEACGDTITINITYCRITEATRYRDLELKEFYEDVTREHALAWFEELINEYAKWVIWDINRKKLRDESIKGMPFPYSYRKGQFDLVKGVYLSILREKLLFLQAPTGVGKTLSTVFPSVAAMGEGLTDKIFYLTAKTITRTVAEESLALLTDKGVNLRSVTITAKDKICILEKPECDPKNCERARGHFDRINDAIYDMITHEDNVSRETINEYAMRHKVCPFEMCLDVTLWSDVIICDYNYVFDPKVYLKRFFAEGEKSDYVFLIDEAHNLVERARSMYSATLCKELVADVSDSIKAYDKGRPAKRNKASSAINYNDAGSFYITGGSGALGNNETADSNVDMKDIHAPGDSETDGRSGAAGSGSMIGTKRGNLSRNLTNALDKINKMMLEYKRSCDEFEVVDSLDSFIFPLMRVITPYEDFLKDALPDMKDYTNRDNLLQLYFDIRFFLNIYELIDENYRIYMSYNDSREFCITLQCMDPSTNLKEYIGRGRSAVFFSATLLPVRYYMDQLGGTEEDYAVYAESSFDPENMLVLAATDVSSRYTRRNEAEYRKIGEYIREFVAAKTGNYIVFFPSYKMMNDVLDAMPDDFECIVQQSGMNEEDREEFLEMFREENDETLVAFCVMGGIFGEGIDLKDDMLIGVVIVGTGLPMVGNERELYRSYYDERSNKGFEYAYLYPGMNKVLQAAGRVIRTITDRGCILLLDERFGQNQYTSLFPREWNDIRYVNIQKMKDQLRSFWAKGGNI